MTSHGEINRLGFHLISPQEDAAHADADAQEESPEKNPKKNPAQWK